MTYEEPHGPLIDLRIWQSGRIIRSSCTAPDGRICEGGHNWRNRPLDEAIALERAHMLGYLNRRHFNAVLKKRYAPCRDEIARATPEQRAEWARLLFPAKPAKGG